eukprot:1171906-Rhodomonas_salina.3
MGTGAAALDIGVRACYTVPGTDVAYEVPGCYADDADGEGRIILASYDFAMRCPVLTYCMPLPGRERRALRQQVAAYVLATQCPVLT